MVDWAKEGLEDGSKRNGLLLLVEVEKGDGVLECFPVAGGEALEALGVNEGLELGSGSLLIAFVEGGVTPPLVRFCTLTDKSSNVINTLREKQKVRALLF